MLNNNGSNIGDGLNFVTCERSLICYTFIVRCFTLKGLFTPNDSVTVTETLTGSTLDLSDGTVKGGMGCIPVLFVNVTFVTESLGVSEPLTCTTLTNSTLSECKKLVVFSVFVP